MDRWRIDDHKLTWHLPRVRAWLEQGDAWPIYAEISPSGACNHRCVFCALDYLEYRTRFLDPALMGERLAEMAGLGLRSVLFGGEGEPLLNRGLADIAAAGRAAGLDLALTTNGVLLTAAVLERLLDKLQWIKVSFNAGTAETYAKVHRTSPADFVTVLENLRAAVRLRRESGSRCTLGAQLLLLPENEREVEEAARIFRDIGLDYLVVKPYSQHLFSRTRRYEGVSYADFAERAAGLGALGDASFSVIVRLGTMRSWDQGERGFEKCLALPFWTYVDAGASVWGCSAWLGDERFLYGNLAGQSFREIWEGERRRRSLAFVEAGLDTRACRVNCRMAKVNRFLRSVRTPPPHVNFI